MSAERALRLSPELGYDPLPAWQYLSRHVRRYPYDLRAHVQRILLAKDDGLGDRLEGSLLDLFLALDNSGQMLRTRVLDICTDDLGDETKTLFQDMLENGTATKQSTPWLNGSTLATGESSKPLKLLTLQRVESSQSYSSLQAEIQDCLEYGQIEIAQELLETEILAGRATPELEQELLTIYQHTRNRDGLEAFAVAWNATGTELSEDWLNALKEAGNW
ncbi:MAG: hypothetical protein ACPGSM_01060 [Thiolinea sp.]